MGTGAPWSEQKEGTTFEEWFVKHFGSDLHEDVEPSQEQDFEWCTAHPTGNGLNSMVKGSSACNVSGGRETARIICAVRSVLFPTEKAAVIYSSMCCSGTYPTKFWVALKVEEEVLIPADYGNNRCRLYRSSPESLAEFMSEDIILRIKAGIGQGIELAMQEIIDKGSKERKVLKCTRAGGVKYLGEKPVDDLKYLAILALMSSSGSIRPLATIIWSLVKSSYALYGRVG